MKQNVPYIDIFNYSANKVHGIDPNQSVLGQMKDEYEGKVECIYILNLTAVQMNKVAIYYDKPLYVGFTVLDQSKTLM